MNKVLVWLTACSKMGIFRFFFSDFSVSISNDHCECIKELLTSFDNKLQNLIQFSHIHPTISCRCALNTRRRSQSHPKHQSTTTAIKCRQKGRIKHKYFFLLEIYLLREHTEKHSVLLLIFQ